MQQFLVQLQVARRVGGGVAVAALAVAGIELGHAACALTDQAGGERGGAQEVELLLHLVLAVEEMAGVALGVVVLEVLEVVAHLQAVPHAAGGEVHHERVDRVLGAQCPRHGAGEGPVQAAVHIVPDEDVGAAALHHVGVDAVAQALGALAAPAGAHVEADAVLVVGGRGAVGVLGQGIGRDRLGTDVAGVAEGVATEHQVEVPELAAVEEAGTALQGVIVAPPLRTLAFRGIVHPGEHRGPGPGLAARVSGAHVDDPAQGRAAVHHAAGPLDHLHLLQVLDGQEGPRRPADVTAQDRHVVHQHHHPAAGTVAEPAARADLRVVVDHHHAWHLVHGVVERVDVLVLDHLRRQHAQRLRHLAHALFKTPGGDHHHVQELLGCGQGHIQLKLLSGNQRAFLRVLRVAHQTEGERVGAGCQRESIAALGIGGGALSHAVHDVHPGQWRSTVRIGHASPQRGVLRP